MLAEPITFKSRGYQSYIVLTMCRILYTLQHGAVVSKHAAADWAQASLGARWRPVIERAFTGRRMPQAEAQPDDADETLNLMRYTLARSQQFEPPTGDA
jgi:hypothetical protein